MRRDGCLVFHFSQHIKDVRPRDRVLVYLNRNGAGIYAIGEVASVPRNRSKRVRVRLRPLLTRRLLVKPLPPEFFRRLGITLFSAPRKVVHRVTEEQWEQLDGVLHVLHPKLCQPKRRIRPPDCHTCEILNRCWNCSRLYHRAIVPRKERFLNSLSRVSGLQMVRAAEQYIPRNAPGGQSDDFGKVLRRFKEGDRKYEYRLAISLLQFLAQRAPVAFRKAEVVVPVPSHASKVKRRGYNPPTVLARFIAQYYGIPFSPVLVQGKRITRRRLRGRITDEAFIEKYQAGLKVRGGKKIAGKRVLLVDDVITDGATLRAVSGKLAEVAGDGARVYALGLALTQKQRKLL